MSIPQETEDGLRHELGRFFHRELDTRYDLAYIRNIPAINSRGLLEALDQQQLDQIKEFFKRVMYPVGTERIHQDQHMERVMSILNSTSSVLSMLPSLPGLFLRHGTRIPSVSIAGLQVISAYQHARIQEQRILASLIDIVTAEYGDIDEATDLPDEVFQRAYAALSEHDLHRMTRSAEKSVRLGADEKLMVATIDLVQALRDHVHDRSEAAALEYVRLVAEDVQGLSGKFSRRRIDDVLELAHEVEHHYFHHLPRF